MKKIILLTITILSVIMFLIGAMAIDSESDIFFYMCLISLCWLVPFAYANKDSIKKM